MTTNKSLWTTIAGSLSSVIPMFFTVCKTGACTAVCVSPVASLLGISSASLMASPLTQSLFPLLIAISAVAFTASYYKIYVLPKYNNISQNNCGDNCQCIPSKKSFQQRFTIWTFWIGLIVSIFLFSYFEYQNYNTNKISLKKNKIESNIVTKPNILDSNAEEKSCCSGNQTCN